MMKIKGVFSLLILKIGMRKNYKSIFNILIFTSLIFVVLYLVNLDFISLKVLHFNHFYQAVSIIALVITMLWGAITWGKILSQYHINIPSSAVFASHGMSIFAKYIPGKVWSIIGRAVYVSKIGHPLSSTSFLSAKLQISNVLIGLMFGTVPLIIFGYSRMIIPLTIFLILFLMLISLSDVHCMKLVGVLNKIIKKKISLQVINRNNYFKILFFLIALWFMYSASYFLFIKSLHSNVDILTAFAFPLAMNIGLLAFFIPGGFGVREGVMVGYLNLAGLSLPEATTISIAARLWFLIGEVFMFIIGVIADRHTRKTRAHKSKIQT